MPEKQEPQEKNALEKLQEIIASAKQEINAEFERTKPLNDYIDCIGSMEVAIRLFFENKQIQQLLSREQYEKARKKLEILREKMAEARTKYPTQYRDLTKKISHKEPMQKIDEKTKQELINALDILKE